MRFGIIGAGAIARKMAWTVSRMKGVDLTAIGAREIARAKDYADEYGFQKAYGSYEDLLADPAVDLVYIALPHSHHREWTLKALEAGKHVLCEKAFAASEAQAREMIGSAKEKGLLLTEAIWTRYMPSRKQIDELLQSGEIGRVVGLTANLGYDIDTKERIIRPELAGGALLDLTVYPLNFASMIFGNDIAAMQASCSMTDTGVDGQDSVTLHYRDGRIASMYATIYSLTDRRGMIYGEDGFIEVQNINNPEKILVYANNRDSGAEIRRVIDPPPQITGYEYEVEACVRAIENGQTECPEMPHSETLEIMRQMDAIRAQFGIVYPWETAV